MVVLNVSRSIVQLLRDSSQAENASHAKHTQELSTTERPVPQISVPPEKRFSKTELAKCAQTITEPSPTEENAPARSVPPDRSFKSTADVLTATHTPELPQMERSVCHTSAQTDRNLDQMEPASTAQSTRELKEPASAVDLILVTSERECCRMVLASTAHSTNQCAPTEDAAASQLASQALSTSPRMVSASNAPSIRRPDQTAPRARLTQRRSYQTHKSLHQLQSHSRPPRSPPAAPPLAATSGPTSSSCPRIRPPDSTSTSRLETSASCWATP